MKFTHPQQRFYTFNHLWVCPQGAHMIIGATPGLICPIHPLAGIHISEPGIVMDEGDEAGHFTLAAGNKVHFRLPFSGMITNSNPLLHTQPDVWCHDPYGLGWLFSMEAVEPADLKLLLNAAQYSEMAALLVI